MKQGSADTYVVQKPVWLIKQEMSNHEQQKPKNIISLTNALVQVGQVPVIKLSKYVTTLLLLRH